MPICLADEVGNGEDVTHVGAHLDVDVDEATLRKNHTSFFGADLLAVGRPAYGLQHQVVDLWRWRGTAGFMYRRVWVRFMSAAAAQRSAAVTAAAPALAASSSPGANFK